VNNIPLVLLLGILSTIQLHLAKALERQGIEVFEQIKTRLQNSGQRVENNLKKPLIYSVGLILNYTVFIYAVLAQPYGPPALFTSMFGIGLVFLIVYAGLILKEKVTRVELFGAGAIVAGTLVIGIENIFHTALDRFTMRLPILMIALSIWLALSLGFVVVSIQKRNLSWMALAFGLLAGGLGSLDPFFKGIGQNYGGQSGLLPANLVGMLFFISSFILGFLAFLVTQFGFAQKARASLLVPAYNAAYIGLPVLWQILLLPGYRLTGLTFVGLLLVIGGVMVMQKQEL
jgi:drug/metabolite transporter (DMT)-like permease